MTTEMVTLCNHCKSYNYTIVADPETFIQNDVVCKFCGKDNNDG